MRAILLFLFLLLVAPIPWADAQSGGEILPDELKDTWRAPDYSDKGFTPIASHRRHYLEWLGVSASEEKEPKDPDDFNDGLFVINPRNFGPGNKVILAVRVSTRWKEQPAAFNQPPNISKLGIWIDWNYNKNFEANERVYHDKFDVPFEHDNKKVPHSLLFVEVNVPDSFRPDEILSETRPGLVPPSIRARVGFMHQNEDLKPGGDMAYGEVEDHTFSLNDLAYFLERPTANGTTAELSVYGQHVVRGLLGSNIAIFVYDSTGKQISSIIVDSMNTKSFMAAFKMLSDPKPNSK